MSAHILGLFFLKWLLNLCYPLKKTVVPQNILILSQNIENKWKKSFLEQSKLCPCWGTVGGLTEWLISCSHLSENDFRGAMTGEGSAGTTKSEICIIQKKTKSSLEGFGQSGFLAFFIKTPFKPAIWIHSKLIYHISFTTCKRLVCLPSWRLPSCATDEGKIPAEI